MTAATRSELLRYGDISFETISLIARQDQLLQIHLCPELASQQVRVMQLPGEQLL